MSKKLGILGGGQLGLMMMKPAEKLGIDIAFLDPDPNCSTQVRGANHTVGDFKDYQTVLDFGRSVDVISIEIENVNVDALEKLESEGKSVFPSPKILRMIQDKGLQKQFYKDAGLPSSEFEIIENKDQITQFPIVQKMRVGGYDGKGVQVLKSEADLDRAFVEPSVLEALVDIDLEVGVIVIRDEQGEVRVLPPVDMEFCPKLNLVKYVKMPSEISELMNNKCVQLATDVANNLELVGLLAVEFFITKDGEVLINEMAPRVHNSGHLTIEGLNCSQFEGFLRAIMGIELPVIEMKASSVMVNLVGADGHEGTSKIQDPEGVLEQENIYLHWYEKSVTRPGRKMGHVTITADSVEEAKALGDLVLEKVQVTT